MRVRCRCPVFDGLTGSTRWWRWWLADTKERGKEGEGGREGGREGGKGYLDASAVEDPSIV